MIKKISMIVTITLLSLVCLAENKFATNKKYPSYPDVWGYDLSNYHATKTNKIYLEPYKSKDGDIVFLIDIKEGKGSSLEEKFDNTTFIVIKFFGKSVNTIKGSDWQAFKLKNAIDNDSINPVDMKTIKLKDGSIIQPYSLPGGSVCQYNELAQKMLLKGKLKFNREELSFYDEGVEKISIIGSTLDIWRYIDKGDGMCERGGPKGGELIYKQLYFLPSYIIDLHDDSFITYSANFIIRFDKNFVTKFKPNMHIDFGSKAIDHMKGNFFVVPYSKIEELDTKAAQDNDHAVQGLHDRLWLYLNDTIAKSQ